MPKSKSNTKPKANATEERLRATPFDNVSDLDAETKAIRLAVWRRFAEATIINELLTKPDLAFIKEEWKQGLIAFFGKESTDRIFKVYSDGKGIKMEFNKRVTRSLDGKESQLIESIIKAGIEGFGLLYYKSKSIVGDPIFTPNIEQDVQTKDAKSAKSKLRSKKQKSSGLTNL